MGKEKTDEGRHDKLRLAGIGKSLILEYIERKKESGKISQRDKDIIEDIKEDFFQTGFFYATRALTYLGKIQITPEEITPILQTMGIEADKDKIKEAVVDYNTKEQDILAKLKQRKPLYERMFQPTDEGLLLKISENGDHTIEVSLEENSNQGETQREKLEQLVKTIEIIAKVIKKDIEYKPGEKGDGDKLTIKLLIGDLNKFDKFEPLYRNLSKTLLNRMAAIDKERKVCPQSLLNDIEFWTHLTGYDICKRGDRIRGIGKKYSIEKKLTELADFSRELFGIIQGSTGITKEQIYSNEKSIKIAKQRHIGMYIVYNKFSFLSSVNVGAVFGEIGFPKNHATILLATKKFEDVEKVGLNPKMYKRINDAEKLYTDALRKYEAAKKLNRRKTTSPSKSSPLVSTLSS